MTKLELRMTNNELEARIIELEAIHKDDEEKLADAREELTTVMNECALLDAQYRDLEQSIVEEAAARPAIPYAEWYRMIHPMPGGDPDLRALEATKYARIIA